MRKFAWLTFITGLVLSGIAGYYSVVGLAMIFAGAYWSVVVLASILEVAKLVAVTWLYRYRFLAGRLLRMYFYGAVLVIFLVTSMGIFGYLTRAHAETEGALTEVSLTLDEINTREQSIKSQQTNLTNELTNINSQSNQLITQLGARERLTGTSGAVTVQRQTSLRKQAILAELKQSNTDLSTIQKERIAATTLTSQTTAEIGPLRYVAKAIYGTDDIDTIRKAVIFLTLILMVVFDPMALMLLIAANVLFMEADRQDAAASAPSTAPQAIVAPIPPTPDVSPTPDPATPTTPVDAIDTHGTEIPEPLRGN